MPSFINKVLGISKVTQMMGNIAFNIDKGYAWAMGVGNGLATIPGIITAAIGLPAGGIDAVVTRYHNMQRQPKIIPPKNLDNLPWYKKGIHKLCVGATYVYWGYTAAGGFLSSFALSKLVAYVCQSVCNQFYNECSEKLDDAPWKDVLVFGSAILLMFSAIASYYKYNLMKMKNEYIPNALSGGWSEYPKLVYAVSTINVGVGVALAKLQNEHTADLFSQVVLERISSSWKITSLAKNLFTGIGMVATFFSSILMTFPAVANLANRKKLSDYSQILPNWWKMRGPINASIGINSLVYGFGGAASIALAGYSFLGLNPRGLVLVIFSGVGGVLSGFITVALDKESHNNEIITRWKLLNSSIQNNILEHKNDLFESSEKFQTQSNNVLTAPLISENKVSSDIIDSQSRKKSQVKVDIGEDSSKPLLSPTRTAGTLFHFAKGIKTSKSANPTLAINDVLTVYDPPDNVDKMNQLFDNLNNIASEGHTIIIQPVSINNSSTLPLASESRIEEDYDSLSSSSETLEDEEQPGLTRTLKA